MRADLHKKLTTKAPDGATLPVHLMASLKVCLLGYGLGALVGVPLGIFMAWSKWCAASSGPSLT